MNITEKECSLDYSGISKIGKIEIYEDQNGVCIVVHGFEFDTPDTCRVHGMRAMAWARDVLSVEIEARRLVPGGHICGASGDTQKEVDEAYMASTMGIGK